MTRDGPPDRPSRPTIDRRTFLAGIALGGALGSSGLAGASRGRDPGPRKDELLVGVSTEIDDVRGAVRSAIPGNAEIVHANDAIKYAAVTFPANANERGREGFVRAVERSADVEYVEPNATVEAFFEPDDPHYGGQYAPQRVNCETAWETTLGDEDVLVAVVDQGIQYDHPDLAAAFGEPRGGDFVGSGTDPYPASADERHGTHVGGIVAGRTDDGTGHAGISDCSLLSVRALDGSGRGALSDIADAIQWAADEGADVINLSLGTDVDYATLASACEYAADRGALLVAAAGNGGGDAVAYPAAYEDAVAVSALDENDSIATFSNRGPQIDLAAPGTSVLSAVPWDSYARMSGTSMAAPVVAGVAALALSAYPGLSADELRDHLLETAVDVGLAPEEQGHGRVDAGEAVTTDPFPDEGDESQDGDERDEDGAEDDGSTECGEETLAARAEGYLSRGWWSGSDRYSYALRTAEPCSATLELAGPSDADFDLYVTLDGRSASPWDHDEASARAGSDESVTVSLSGDETIGIQVYAYSGSGAYELTVEERGR